MRSKNLNTQLSTYSGSGVLQFDGMVRELKEVKRNLISVGALESLGLGVSIKEGVLRMTKVRW